MHCIQFSRLSVSLIAAERTRIDIFNAVCSVMVASLLLIQTDLAVFDIQSTTVDYNDGALVNKYWRITWKSVKLNVLILVVETIGNDLLSILMNRICTVI